MSKFPRLEMMRAQRQRREDEITEPYKAEIRTAADMIARLRQTVRKMEEFFGRDIAKHVTEQIAYNISQKLREMIYKAATSAKHESPEPVRIMLPPDMLRFMDMGSIEQTILRQYTEQNLPKLSLRLDHAPDQYATIIDIRVPELGCRQAVVN
jgi:hypothetical protein